MYQHPLGRLLIYTDKETKQDFHLSKEIWNELYTLFVSTKYNVLDKSITFIDFLNEVFYLLTYTYANENAAEQIEDYFDCYNPLCPPMPELDNPQTPADKKAAKEYESMHDEINGFILYFVWYILHQQAELPPHVNAFYIALDRYLEDCSFDFDVAHIYDYADEHKDKFLISFAIHPDVELTTLLRSTDEWKEATNDFDRIIVEHIVARFDNPEDKITIINEIRKHLEQDNKNLHRSNRMVSLVTHRKKANDAFLDKLLAEAEQKDHSNPDSLNLNRVIKGGFADYILDNHPRVIDILMLIAHLGHNQMPLIIKTIRALQRLGYFQNDCFNDPDEFIKHAKEQFPDVNFDPTNVKRQIKLGEGRSNEKYQDTIQMIAKYIDSVINV